MAGIINIVLKQNTDLGLSAGLNAGFAKPSRFNAVGNVGYQQRTAMTLFGTYGFNSDDRAIVGINDRERFAAQRVDARRSQNQDIDGRDRERRPQLHHQHRLQAHRQGRSLQRAVGQPAARQRRRPRRLRRPRCESGLRRSLRHGPQHPVDGSDLFDNSLSLEATPFEPRKHELSTEVRFNRSTDESNSSARGGSPRIPMAAAPARASRARPTPTDGVTKQLTAQAGLHPAAWAKAKLETGVKETDRWLDQDFVVYKDALGNGQLGCGAI